METQFQANNKNITLDTLVPNTNVAKKTQTIVSTSSVPTSSSTTHSAIPVGIAGGGTTTVNTNTATTNYLTTNNTINTVNQQIVSTSNGQPASQQIIQVSSQGGAIMSGQQLMVQTLSGRPAIQLRTQAGQFQQIQLIPFGNQRQPVIIQQQTPNNVLHSTQGATITSMANLPHNVAKITSVSSNNSLTGVGTHQKPVIIQQSTGQFIHSSNSSHGIHHNVAKITTVGRASSRPTQGKMINFSTSNLSHLTNSSTSVTSNHNAQNQAHQLATTTLSNATPQQVTRLNIISSLPSGVHSSVSNVQQHGSKPIISLAAAALNKPLIINPATNVVQPSIVSNVSGATVHGLVNVNNFNSNPHQLKTQTSNTNLIPTVMTLTTLTTSSGSLSTRHTMINSTSSTSQSQNINQRLTVSSSSNATGHPVTNQQLINSNLTQSSHPLSSNVQHHQSTNNLQNISGASLNHSLVTTSIRTNYLTTSTNSNQISPMKQQITQQTPSSPRPSILIRKRVGTSLDDSKSISTNSINSNSANITSNSTLNPSLVKSNLALKYNTSNSNLFNKNSQEIINKSNMTNKSFKRLDFSQITKDGNDLSKNIENKVTNELASTNSNQVLSNNNYLNSNNLDNNKITPRKRRKQLLEPFMLNSSQSEKISNSNEDMQNISLCNEEISKKKEQINYINNSIMSFQSNLNMSKKPRPSLLSSYNVTWKSLQYHFLRHSEIKIRSDKKSNLADLTNESLQKKNGWKVHHLSMQVEDLLENEITFNQKILELSKVYTENIDNLPSKVKEIGNQPFNAKICHNSVTIIDKLNDLFAANIQRSNLFQDQIKETNSVLVKLTNDHKDKVVKITRKLLNKRNHPNLRDQKV